jgi:hypothetical protein
LQRQAPQKNPSADEPEVGDVGNMSLFVSVGPEGGESCPILYMQGRDSSSWIALGKVLHQANGADAEMTEVIELPYLQTHFRLSEEEPEISYIKNATLRLTLADGRHLDIPSRQVFTRIIPAYTAVDVDFDLPSGASAGDIVASSIALTGYYERYAPTLSLVRSSR